MYAILILIDRTLQNCGCLFLTLRLSSLFIINLFIYLFSLCRTYCSISFSVSYFCVFVVVIIFFFAITFFFYVKSLFVLHIKYRWFFLKIKNDRRGQIASLSLRIAKVVSIVYVIIIIYILFKYCYFTYFEDVRLNQ